MKKTLQAIFVTLIFILATFQSAYAIGDSFTYDANGNMIQGPGGLYYEYNDANQLKRVRGGGPTGEVIAEYWYDHTGKRIKKSESGVVTYYWTDTFEQTVYPNGTVVNTTYYFANGERLAKNVSTDSGSKMYYFYPDHLGSTSVVSNEGGNLVEKTEYYPYGSTKEGGGEQYLFTGKELDKSTGLYYYGARYYNPELMRFVQADAVIPDLYNPQALNRYTYVLNNPLKYTDPSGNLYKAGVVAGMALTVTGGILIFGAAAPVAVGAGAVIFALGYTTTTASLIIPEEAGPAIDTMQAMSTVPGVSTAVFSYELYTSGWNVEKATKNTQTFNDIATTPISAQGIITAPKKIAKISNALQLYGSSRNLYSRWSDLPDSNVNNDIATSSSTTQSSSYSWSGYSSSGYGTCYAPGYSRSGYSSYSRRYSSGGSSSGYSRGQYGYSNSREAVSDWAASRGLNW